MKIPRIALILVPALMFFVGFTLNAVVVAANQGQMPVLYPGGCDSDAFEHSPIHVCMTPHSKLKILADWIPIRGVGIASIGDFFEWGSETISLPCYIGFFVLYFNDKRYFGS